MRYLIAIFLAALATLFVLSFATGFGYATGGGEASVRILTDEVVAHSESGQAVAVGWSEIENFNASNTPQPRPNAEPGAWLPAIGLFGGLAIVLALVLGQAFGGGRDDDDYESNGWTHFTSTEGEKNKRKYGPEGG